jgi:UDP-N-acetylglucosamine--N-acetylmuramyl-(pentapeptide) pyrophosphoryl-undecaprenol N-acetylglucosamine transferase
MAQAQAAYQESGVAAEVIPFIVDMAEAYGWADLVIGRAGALTLSELAAAGVGAVLVPFPYAVDDHQTKNAAWLVDAGAAILLPQSELSPERLAAILRPQVNDRRRHLALAQAARDQAMTEADDTLARACLEVSQS